MLTSDQRCSETLWASLVLLCSVPGFGCRGHTWKGLSLLSIILSGHCGTAQIVHVHGCLTVPVPGGKFRNIKTLQLFLLVHLHDLLCLIFPELGRHFAGIIFLLLNDQILFWDVVKIHTPNTSVCRSSLSLSSGTLERPALQQFSTSHYSAFKPAFFRYHDCCMLPNRCSGH